MNQINSLFTLRLEPNVLLDLIVNVLEKDGLRVICSFDLQAACVSFEANICPHHGEAPCDCQMLIMLVYGEEGAPLSLVAHGHRGRVQVGIREEGAQVNQALETRVRSLLGVSRIVKEVRQLKLATG